MYRDLVEAIREEAESEEDEERRKERERELRRFREAEARLQPRARQRGLTPEQEVATREALRPAITPEYPAYGAGEWVGPSKKPAWKAVLEGAAVLPQTAILPFELEYEHIGRPAAEATVGRVPAEHIKKGVTGALAAASPLISPWPAVAHQKFAPAEAEKTIATEAAAIGLLPSNVLPGVGFGREIVAGGKALLRAGPRVARGALARRAGVETAEKAPEAARAIAKPKVEAPEVAAREVVPRPEEVPVAARAPEPPADFAQSIREAPRSDVPDPVIERALSASDPYASLERAQATASSGGPPVHTGRTLIDSGGTDPSLPLRDMFDRRGLPTIREPFKLTTEVEPQMIALHRRIYGRFNEWAAQEKQQFRKLVETAKQIGYRRRVNKYDHENIAGWLAANGEQVAGFEAPPRLARLVRGLRSGILREEAEILAVDARSRRWFLKGWYFPRLARRQAVATVRLADNSEIRIPARYLSAKKVGDRASGTTWRGQQIEGEITEVIRGGESSMIGAGAQRPGTTPPFRRHRVYRSLEEFLDAGEEPMTWDLVDQLMYRRVIGQQFRDQKYALDLMKESGHLVPAGTPGTEGWIKPPWPAADPWPFVTKEGEIARLPSLVMSPEDWQAAQHMFPSRGMSGLGGMRVIDEAFGEVKKANIVWSFFQHIDIGLTRGIALSVSEARPAGLITGPKSIALAFSPSRARAAYDASSAANPWKRLLRQQGLGAGGGDLLKEEALTALRMPDDPLTSFPFMRFLPAEVRQTRVARAIDGGFQWFQGGLFDYTYRVMLEDSGEAMLKARIRGTASWKALRDGSPARPINETFERWLAENTLEGERYAAEIVRAMNERLSAKPLWQRAIKSAAPRMVMRFARFGPVEAESLIGYALKPILGPKRVEALKYWVGAYLGLAAMAEALNIAFTGHPLGRHQLIPFERDKDNPLGVSFNTQFLRPDLGPLGEGGRHLYLDLLGQLDYPLRLSLDPAYWLRSGLPPLPATMLDLQMGTDVVGNPVKLPWALPKLLTPISLVGWFEEKARIGVVGSILQTVGINVSTERIGQIRHRLAEEGGYYEKYPDAKGKFEYLPEEAKAEIDENEEVQRAIGIADAERVERVGALSKDKRRDIVVSTLKAAEDIFNEDIEGLGELPPGAERRTRYRAAVVDRQNAIALSRYMFPSVFEEWDEDEYDPEMPVRNLNVRKRQEIFEKHRDPDSLKIPTDLEVLELLFDELEEFEATLSPQELDDLYKDIGAERVDWVKEEQRENRYIREAGWWDRLDMLFGTISYGTKYGDMSYRQFRRHIYDMLRKSGVHPSEQAINEKIPLLFRKGEEFLRWIGTGKDSRVDHIRLTDPKLEAYLLKHERIGCMMSNLAIMEYKRLTGLRAELCERAE